MMPPGVPAAVRKKRDKLGMPLRVAAEDIGISAQTLWRIEHGMTITLDTLAKVALWLGRPVSELLGEGP